MIIEYEVAHDNVGDLKVEYFEDLEKALACYFEALKTCTQNPSMMFWEVTFDDENDDEASDYYLLSHQEVLNLYEDFHGEKKEEVQIKDYIL